MANKSFDFNALLTKKHGKKPPHLVSVAGGVKNRLEKNIKNQKSSRLTAFDSIRELPKCESPAPPISKMEHRRQQLEKWKMEKEKKKKEQAAQKKKPFLTGVARAPLKFVPPPPPPKPCTSGRVTRSQTKNATLNPKPVKPTPKGRNTQSFAPKYATFRPPEIKNLVNIPKLVPPSKSKNKKASMITFEPIVPNAVTTAKQVKTRPVLTRQNATESKSSTRSKPQVETRTVTRGKARPSPKKLPKKPLQSSSSGSDIDTAISKIQNPSRKSLKGPKPLTPKTLAMESTSEEKSSSDSSSEISKRKSLRKSIYSIRDSQSSSNKVLISDSSIEQSSKEETTVISNPRKSLPRNRRATLTATSSSDRTSSASDVEFIKELSPVVFLTSLPATPKLRVPKSESSSEEKLRSPKSPINLVLSPEQMESAKNSPYVTMSRGKDNVRKEMKWKIDEGLLDDDASDADSVNYFRKQLSSEIKRMTEMCDTWDKISEQTVLPEPVQEALLSAVGQCRLLMRQKLQQFASLVERCASPKPGAAVVTPADLRGFWDMVFMQIENVDLRFKNLEELRQRNWVEERPLPAHSHRPAVAKPLAKKLARPPAANSRIREMIAAARKAKKDQAQTLSPSTLPAPPTEGEKTFNAGFFSVRSPLRAPSASPLAGGSARGSLASTPASKPTLLKAVLSSEAKKASYSRNSTPFAMLRASILAKNAECAGVAPLPQTPQMNPVNISATPGRSILKSTNANKSGKKSIKAVLFNASDSDSSDQPSVFQDYLSNMPKNDRLLFDDTSPKLTARELEDLVLDVDKENSRSPEVRTPRTRSQTKRLQNISNVEDKEVKTPRRSSRKKDPEEIKKTPVKSSRKKKV